MNRIAFTLALTLTLASAALLSGCGGGKTAKTALPAAEPEIAFTLPEELAAHWVNFNGSAINAPDIMELLGDGTGTADEEAVIAWKVIDSRLVLLPRYEDADESDSFSLAYRVDGARLTLTDEDGDSGLYVKKGYIDALHKGESYMDDEDYDAAIAEYSKAAQIDPDFPKAFSLRGAVYFEKKDFDKAIADFNEMIRLEPDSSNGYVLRGSAYYEMKDYGKALADFNRAISLDPDSEIGYIGRSHVYLEEKEYDGAIADITQWIKTCPRCAAAYNNRGWAYCLKGEYDRGLEDIEKAIGMDGEAHYIYHSRGYAYSGKKEYDKAIADFTESLRLKPTDEAFTDRGKAYIEKGDYAAAVVDFGKALELNPEYPGAAEGLEKAKGLLESKAAPKKPNSKAQNNKVK